MRIPVSAIVLLCVISASSAKPNEMVAFACQFFEGMFNDCDNTVECPADESITNSNDTTIAGTIGESYPFTCKTGFNKLGSNGSISCVTDGQGGPDGIWHIDSHCKAVECPACQQILNSDDTTIAGTFGESYPFTCKTGFTKLGSNGSISCVADGQGGPDGKWQIDSPCEAVECPADQQITNSNDTTIAGTFGESYSFTCKTGFTKLGSNGSISCVTDEQGGPDGKWQIDSLCEAVECPADQQITNSNDTTIAGTFGESYPFTCKTGFTKLGSNGNISCVTDGQGGPDGKWQIDSSCEVVECIGDPVINSDDMTTQGIFGIVSWFNCNVGFTANGNTGSKTCGADGQWQVINGCKDCYNYTSTEFIETKAIIRRFNVQNQAVCDQWCNGYKPQCTTGVVTLDLCYLLVAPVIYGFSDTDVDQCKAQCTQRDECLMFNYLGQQFKQCVLFNETLINLPDNGFFRLIPFDESTIAERLC